MDIFKWIKRNSLVGHKCDTCGKSTEQGDYVPIHIEFGYGSDLDGASYDFCSYKCLLQFIIAELKKEQ